MTCKFAADRAVSALAGLLLASLLGLGTGCEEGTRPMPEPGEMPGGAGAPATDTPAPGEMMQPDGMLQTDPTAPLGKLTTSDGVIRIMPIGDSITRATCWRAGLWQRLNASFAGRFDFVGTVPKDNGCAPAGYDLDNQAYSSSLVTEIVAGIQTRMGCDPSPCPTLAQLQEAFMMRPTDVALIHFGTNDVWNSRAPNDIVNGYTQVVDALRVANPKVVVLVAEIIPMNVTDMTCMGCTCASCVTGIPALNDAIVAWAAEHDTADSPIRVVDQFTGYDATADNRDGVHPNAQGDGKLADHWFQALEPLF